MTDLNTRMNEASWYNGDAIVIVPAPFKGGLSTMVRCVQLGTNTDGTRPKYGYQLSLIAEGGPELLVEAEDVFGPAVGVWPEANEMALQVLGWLATDPDDIGDGYGDNWSDALREWNASYGEGLEFIHSDMSAAQCGNATDGTMIGGVWTVTEDHLLTNFQALLMVTEVHRLTWLADDPAEYADDADRAAVAGLVAFWA